MKKKILLLAVCMAALCTYVGLSYIPDSTTDPFVLENIEALAADEVGPDVYCDGIGCVDCPINHVKVEYVWGSYSLD